jgi:hypothetical protein
MQTYTNSNGGLLGSKGHAMPTYDLDSGYQSSLLGPTSGANGSGYFYATNATNAAPQSSDLNCKVSVASSALSSAGSNKFWSNNGLNGGLTGSSLGNGLSNGLGNSLGVLGSSLGSNASTAFDSTSNTPVSGNSALTNVGVSNLTSNNSVPDLGNVWQTAAGLSPAAQSTGSGSGGSSGISSLSSQSVNSIGGISGPGSSVINSQAAANQSMVAGLANASSAWSAACCNTSNAFYPWMAIAGEFCEFIIDLFFISRSRLSSTVLYRHSSAELFGVL